MSKLIYPTTANNSSSALMTFLYDSLLTGFSFILYSAIAEMVFSKSSANFMADPLTVRHVVIIVFGVIDVLFLMLFVTSLPDIRTLSPVNLQLNPPKSSLEENIF